jgi:hypothetical protein
VCQESGEGFGLTVDIDTLDYTKTSDSLTAPDGRTSERGEKLAKKVARQLNLDYGVTKVRQEGYGPASFDVDLGDGLIAKVTVEVRRAGRKGAVTDEHD